MIYFDQAATSLQKPPEVSAAVLRAMDECASIGRSGHPWAIRAGEIAFQCRQEAADLFDAEPEQVVFTFNATHGLNLAVHSLVKPGDRVVISGFEHNAVLRPLYHCGAEILVAGKTLFSPQDTLAEFDRLVTKETKAVFCTHVSNVFGYCLPVAQIADLCRQRGIPFVLDASQSAGVLPVSLRKLHAAFVAMPGHKGLYGPQGTGLLLCGQIPEPLLCGGTGSRSQSPQMPDFLPDAAEAGTHNLPGIAGLLEGIRFVRSKGIDRIFERERKLLHRLHRQIPHLRQFWNGDHQTGVLSIQPRTLDVEQAASILGEKGIAVRAGLHCAPLAHRSAGTLERGTIRISLSCFNTEEEVDVLAEELIPMK